MLKKNKNMSSKIKCSGLKTNGQVCPKKELCGKYHSAGDGSIMSAPFEFNVNKFTCKHYEGLDENMKLIQDDPQEGNLLID